MWNKTRMIEELREKTGMSWVAAARIVVTRPEAAANDGAVGRGALGALLASLRTTSAFAVEVGRTRARGFASTEPGDAVAEMRAALLKPDWYAATGAVDRSITAREFRLLVANGAADHPEIQVFRARADDNGLGWSEQCDACDRHVWLGTEPRSGACFCGRRHRVAFDRDPAEWWGARARGRRCACCREAMETAGEGRALNEWQPRCEACAGGAGALP